MSNYIVILLVVCVVLMAVWLRRKKVGKPYFYGAVICFGLAALSVVIAAYTSSWLRALSFFMYIVFMLTFVWIADTGNKSKTIIEKLKSGELADKFPWFTRLFKLSGKFSGLKNIFFLLLFGMVPSMFIVGITCALFEDANIEGHFVSAEPGAITSWVLQGNNEGLLAPYAIIGLSVAVGIVTLLVTFVFGLSFAKKGKLVGLSAGIWSGLAIFDILMTEPILMRLYVAAVCVLCCYVGADLGVWIHNIVCRLRRKKGECV